MSFFSKLKTWVSRLGNAKTSAQTPPKNSESDEQLAATNQPASILDLFTNQMEQVEANQPSKKVDRGPIDLVICVHNALEDVKKCLNSVLERTHHKYRIILINDGSDATTSQYLQSFQKKHKHCELIKNPESVGYTLAANQGLRHSFAPTVILLNSDTIVTSHWLSNLTEALFSAPKVGIAGPLSNAASWQSVPDIFDGNGDWAINAIPKKHDLESYANLINRISQKKFPKVDFLNGFCLAIKRGVIDEIGFFDETAFPNGYGEENDFCLRARESGFELAIADHTYIYHAKSRSYQHERRQKLSMAGSISLIKKHGAARVKQGLETTRHHPVLVQLRIQLKQVLRSGRRN